MKFEVTENPGAEWDLFVEKHTDILFYSSAWGEVLKQGLGGRPYWLYMKEEEEIVCGLSGVMLSYFGVKLFYSSIPCGGYLGDWALFSQFVERFNQWANAADIVYLSPSFQTASQHCPAHFKTTAEAAIRIDLKGRSLSEVESCFEPSVWQSIKKGKRLDLKAELCEDRASFLMAHRLYLQAMQRNRAIARYSERWFTTLYSLLADKGHAFVCLVRYNGSPVSATVVVNSGKGYHLLHTGSSTEHMQLRVNDLVVCEIIRDGIRKGKEYIDFLRADTLDVGLIKWKEKFGASTTMLNSYSRINSPLKYALWNIGKRIYSFVPVIRR